MRPTVCEAATAPAQGGLVGNREIQPKQPEHTSGEALSLAQGQVEDEPQRQNQLDRQVRIERLSAWCGPSRCVPSSNGGLLEPKCQVASALQPCLILSSVPDAVAGPEALGSVWVWSEGHDGASGLVQADPHLIRSRLLLLRRCTNPPS